MSAARSRFEIKASGAGGSVWNACAKQFRTGRFGNTWFVRLNDDKYTNTRIILALVVSILIHFRLLDFFNDRLPRISSVLEAPDRIVLSFASPSQTSARTLKPSQTVSPQVKRHETKSAPMAHKQQLVKQNQTTKKRLKPQMKPVPEQRRNKPIMDRQLRSFPDMQTSPVLSVQPSRTNSKVIEKLATNAMKKTGSSASQQTRSRLSPLEQLQHKIRVNPGFRHKPQPPVYPSQAIRRHQQGSTQIRAKISRFGDVKKIIIHRSSGFESLDRAAMAAVREWKFVPARENGVTVASWVQMPVNFVLK